MSSAASASGSGRLKRTSTPVVVMARVRFLDEVLRPLSQYTNWNESPEGERPTTMPRPGYGCRKRVQALYFIVHHSRAPCVPTASYVTVQGARSLAWCAPTYHLTHAEYAAGRKPASAPSKPRSARYEARRRRRNTRLLSVDRGTTTPLPDIEVAQRAVASRARLREIHGVGISSRPPQMDISGHGLGSTTIRCSSVGWRWRFD